MKRKAVVTSRKLYRWSQPVIKQQFIIRLTGAAILCIAAFSYADRQPGSLSTIKSNASTGNIEIIHRLHTHDAELGIMTSYSDRSLTLDNLVGRAKLALYIEERFVVAEVSGDRIGAPLILDLIGAELDGDFVLVYQEFGGELPSHIAVRDDILRDVFPEQVNQVNIATGGEVRSLIFQGDDHWQFTNID
ncbi:MAG: hypothetical protein O3A13_13350 [Proteobacteria bacterium]|nr:hypothetical protein [Pseudomonadota bacterium]